MGVRQIPRVKDLNAEFAGAVQAKKEAFREYKKVKAELQESLAVRENISSLYRAEEKEKDTPQGKKMGKEDEENLIRLPTPIKRCIQN